MTGDAGRPAGVLRPQGERERLARLAQAVAAGDPGVAAVDAGAGHRRSTPTPDGPLDGVVCVAAPGGGYDVTLYLACHPVALAALGDGIAAALRSAAVPAGLADALASVAVVVTDVVEAGA